MTREDIQEAVRENIDYLTNCDIYDVALFLEAIAETVYDGEMLEAIAEELKEY